MPKAATARAKRGQFMRGNPEEKNGGKGLFYAAVLQFAEAVAGIKDEIN